MIVFELKGSFLLAPSNRLDKLVVKNTPFSWSLYTLKKNVTKVCTS